MTLALKNNPKAIEKEKNKEETIETFWNKVKPSLPTQTNIYKKCVVLVVFLLLDEFI